MTERPWGESLAEIGRARGHRAYGRATDTPDHLRALAGADTGRTRRANEITREQAEDIAAMTQIDEARGEEMDRRRARMMLTFRRVVPPLILLEPARTKVLILRS